jgi:hypothetical protein
MNRALYLVLGAMMLYDGAAVACKTDAGCELRDRCVFAKNVEEGVCMHVVVPETLPADREQSKRSWEDKGDTGYPCEFDIDCAPGRACFRADFKRQGYCMKR